MALFKFWLIAFTLVVSLKWIHGHGMMLNPVSRSSAWRLGFPVEVNYNDNEVFCGGFAVQMNQNGGKCGVCGDDYSFPQPRPNENGGIYGLGIIVKKYRPGQMINVRVHLTANHLGTFTFNLCQLMNEHHVETDECFQQHPLQLENGSYELKVPPDEGEFNLKIRLPQNFTCEHCVLRWNYMAGNNWGKCEDGRYGLGCGPQETFRNCADVSILDTPQNNSTDSTTHHPTTSSTLPETTTSPSLPSTTNPPESVSTSSSDSSTSTPSKSPA